MLMCVEVYLDMHACFLAWVYMLVCLYGSLGCPIGLPGGLGFAFEVLPSGILLWLPDLDGSNLGEIPLVVNRV